MLLRKGDRSVLPTECVSQVGMGMAAGQQVERRPGLRKAFRSDSAGVEGNRDSVSLLCAATVILARLHPENDELMFPHCDRNMELLPSTWS